MAWNLPFYQGEIKGVCMKNWILTLTILISTQASFAELAGDDFNQMIQENQKVEAELRNKLQKDAGITFNEKYGSVAKEKLPTPTEAEQVAVSSSTPIWKTKKDRAAKALQKAEMKRLSQELNEAESN